MIVVTGGAGFIGSAVVAALNAQGKTDIVIVDEVEHERKERNIGHLRYERLVGIKDFRTRLLQGDFDGNVEAIIHLGACSDTTEQNWEYLADNNVEYTKDILRWCSDHGVRCLYASSAAVYGDGMLGFSDNQDLLDSFTPLNLYGKSKLLVDIWARDGGYLTSVTGLRYFNIYGPNEWHKEHMRSVVCKKFDEMTQEGKISLFKSEHPDYGDGEQERDFLYVKDAVAMTMFLLERPDAVGVFNIGAGKPHTWNQMATAMFAALGKELNIKYIAMPDHLRQQYQYHTKADLQKIIATGYSAKAMPLGEAITDYIQNYLVPDKHLGEVEST